MTTVTNIENHLVERGVSFPYHYYVDHEGCSTTFYLFDFAGNLSGFQTYNPNGDKAVRGSGRRQKETFKDKAKYWTYVSKGERNRRLNVVWGLETLTLHKEVVFVTEGVFDAVKVHNFGMPALAVLSNDPCDDIMTQFSLLKRTKTVVVLCDADAAGNKLAKLGHFSFRTPNFDGKKDLGDLTQEEANQFLCAVLFEVGKHA